MPSLYSGTRLRNAGDPTSALIALDPSYGPFAQSVLDLAARFKMKAIRQFVARYMPDAPKS